MRAQMGERRSLPSIRLISSESLSLVDLSHRRKLTDGLFIETIGNVAKNYPDIKFETMIVDNTSMVHFDPSWSSHTHSNSS